ncbi:MAG TPA: ATP-binding protein, partial [Pseudonocardiaceae bacterium]
AGTPFWLRCVYDAGVLAPDLLAAARRRHSPDAPPPLSLFTAALPPADPDAATVRFDRPAQVRDLRAAVTGWAAAAGLPADRVADLTLAVHEVAVNSLRHGGGRGTLRYWTEGRSLVCEVSDSGHITDPLVGRLRPTTSQLSGRGVWLANQLCDLVRIRSSASGTTVRLHMFLP